jgi:choice-of-anchor C domain-containing protein
VRVSFTGVGAPLDRAGGKPLSGATNDDYSWNFPVAGLTPGVKLTVKADWEAHASGLNKGFDSRTTSVTIPAPPAVSKLTSADKCHLAWLSKWYADSAAKADSWVKGFTNCGGCAGFMRVVRNQSKANAYKYYKMSQDPPDTNYTVLPTVTVPVVDPVVAGDGFNAAAVTPANDYLRQQNEAYGQARAALTAIERAQGARLAGDSTWEQRQSLAAAEFLKGLSTRLGAIPAASTNLGNALRAAGFPNPTITDADWAAAVHDHLGSVPADSAWLRDQAGLTNDDIAAIGGLMATGTGTKSGNRPLLDWFGDPGLAAAVSDATTGLNSDAAALIANPLLDHADGPPAPGTSQPPTQGPTNGPTTATVTRGPIANEGESLLGNSGFETPALPKGWAYQTVNAGKDPGLGAWTIQKGSVDVVAQPGALAATGGQFIDLNGNDTSDGPGIITQDVAVTPGHAYRLSFQLAGNPNGDPPDKTLDVALGPQKEAFTFNTKGHTNADLGWATHTMEYAACGDEKTVTVTFRSTTEGQRGPNLDNVVLADAGPGCGGGFPWWWIVLGIVLVASAAIGVFFYLRRRAEVAEVGHTADP